MGEEPAHGVHLRGQDVDIRREEGQRRRKSGRRAGAAVAGEGAAAGSAVRRRGGGVRVQEPGAPGVGEGPPDGLHHGREAEHARRAEGEQRR